MTMRNLILAMIAVLGLGIGVANAQSMSHEAPAVQNHTTYNFGGDGG
jgi:hypothetical protein